MLGFDVHGTNLAAVLSGVKIRARSIVRVIETKSCGTRSNDDSAFAMSGYIRVVEHVCRDLLALLEAKQWARKVAVVRGHRDDSLGRHLNCSVVVRRSRLPPRQSENRWFELKYWIQQRQFATAREPYRLTDPLLLGTDAWIQRVRS